MLNLPWTRLGTPPPSPPAYSPEDPSACTSQPPPLLWCPNNICQVSIFLSIGTGGVTGQLQGVPRKLTVARRLKGRLFG